MMMWFEGHTDRFKANVAMMGLYDLPSFHGGTEEVWFPEKDLCGTPWNSEQYDRWSPSRYVEKFKTPSLVITGELDYRVPYTQSLAYFTALKKQGVPSRLIVFPDAGHWPGRRDDRLLQRTPGLVSSLARRRPRSVGSRRARAKPGDREIRSIDREDRVLKRKNRLGRSPEPPEIPRT
jgi:acetyl esterase/lipase